jgi:hypothetical protein
MWIARDSATVKCLTEENHAKIEAFPQQQIGGFDRTPINRKREMIENKHGARCRVRTCDPIRVKDVLYH